MPSRVPNPLSSFGSPVRDWFTASFAEPTPAQALAWPAIAAGEHVLLAAPTGSGKTLAAFLWALDRLSACAQEDRRDPPGVRVLYVSPLKALSYDIERNLRAPLRGIGLEVDVGIRTGDTPQAERAAMARRPPEILITTPESLYLILGSRARTMLSTVQTVIVDEIHAVASVKRGAHLALTLERLDVQASGRVQRVGLSATQSPLEEVGRFLVGPTREVRILDAGSSKPLDLRVQVPVESMTELGGPRADPLDPLGADPLDPAAAESLGRSTLRPHRGEDADAPQGGTDHAREDADRPRGDLSTERGIWPAIYPELLELVRAHRSTIVFVNNRRSAERVALRLDELAGEEIARAHHGSLAREERTSIEEQLKAGTLPCLVATSSLELGIDMGAVDLVVQIESPKSVARGLQRIGRAGHGVGELSKGRVFPKFRGDLVECAVVCRRMREGAIEQTVVPRNALDVLAQQIVAIAAAAEDGATRLAGVAADGRAETERGDSRVREDPEGVSVDELYAFVRRTHSYSELPRALLENVLDMLDGRWAGGHSLEFGELRPRIVWDRVGGRIRARRGARQLAIANAGTIPDRGLYAVTLPDGRRVGELDEEMVYETRPGKVIALGASSWRIEEIGRDRVIVTPAPGVPGEVPFWKGDGVGRPKQLGEAIGAFARWAVDSDERTLAREYDLDERAARNLLEYLREQRAATQVLPSDRTIVLERFRDEIGDWRLCVLSPFGGRVHAAWGLAISARVRERFGIDGEALWSDDGIVVRLPDVDVPLGDEDLRGVGELLGRDDDAATTAQGAGERAWASVGSGAVDLSMVSCAELVALDPDEVEDAVVSELGDSALFGARFRENAGRALLIPRAWPGRRTPLWQQRLKSQSLLEVARRYPDFPIVLETYRECLCDVLDLPGLRELLRGLATREISLVEVTTQSPSPFAGSLLFDYVATYMYEGDTPVAERRAAALSLDRDLLRELLGSEELRELIDPAALAQVEDDLQRRSSRAQATGADELCEVLRRLGDLSEREISERVLDGLDADAMLARLMRERRVARVRIAGEERVIATDDAGLYRDALGVPPPAGLADAHLGEVPDALARLAERYARTHGPFTTSELHTRYGVDASAALRELERAGTLVRGELRPGASDPSSPTADFPTADVSPEPARPTAHGREREGREWCDVEVLRRVRRASLALLRREIEPVDARVLAVFMPSWQGVGRRSRVGSSAHHDGVQRLRETLAPLQGVALPAAAWERDVLRARTGSYSPTWLDSLCASGELVWVGAGPLGRGSGRVALYFRDDAPLIGPPPLRGAGTPAGETHTRLRARLSAGPCFFADLLAELSVPTVELAEALWDLVWAGEVTNDAWAPLRAVRGPAATGPQRPRAIASVHARGLRGSGIRARRASAAVGARLQGRWSLTGAVFATAVDPRERRRALAELLLERYGVLTREQVLAEGVAGGFAALYGTLGELETLGVCRRGYFVEGLGGAQFALPGAVERLRAVRPGAEGSAVVLAAVDPAQPYGAALPWPRREGLARGPARVPGAYVALLDGAPVLYLERGGRGMLTLVDGSSSRESLTVALRALADAVASGAIDAIALERIDGEPAIGSHLESTLVELGFRQGPRRLTLRS